MFWKLPLPIGAFICQWLEDGKLENALGYICYAWNATISEWPVIQTSV